MTYATALIDAPDWLLAAYREGRCRGLKELHEMRKLAGEHPQRAEAWASDREAITRHQVATLRADVSQPGGAPSAVRTTEAPAAAAPSQPSAPPASTRPGKVEARDRPVLRARLDGDIVGSMPIARRPRPGMCSCAVRAKRCRCPSRHRALRCSASIPPTVVQPFNGNRACRRWTQPAGFPVSIVR